MLKSVGHLGLLFWFTGASMIITGRVADTRYDNPGDALIARRI
jgi:hypothetical protein